MTDNTRTLTDDEMGLGKGASSAAPAASPKNLSDSDMGFEAPARGLKGWGRDIAATAVKGAIAVPEALVGLADIPTGGRVGKFLENEGGAVGFRPKQAKEQVNEWHSDATKEAQRKFQEADGVLDKTAVALQNPSLIATSVGESLPSMGLGGVAARGLMAATKLGQMGAKGAVLAGAAGEGATMAGSQAEQIRQETNDGLLNPTQAGLAVATGLAGGAFGVAGGKVAQRLGIGDADTMLAQGIKGVDEQIAGTAARAAANPLVADAAVKSIPRKVIEGAIAEGFLEELPQSMAEQIFQNIALDKPWHEDLDSAAVMGVLSGGAMGAGAAGFHGFRSPAATPAGEPAPGVDPAAPPAEPAAEGAPQPNPGLARVSSEFAARLQALQEQEQGEAQVPQTAPPDGAAALAQQQAQAQVARDAEIAASRAVESPDDEILQSTGATAQRPSEAMGLRSGPEAGTLENAAAMSVDTGATSQLQEAAALDQAAEAAKKAKPANQKQEQSAQAQQDIDPQTGEISGVSGLAGWSDVDLSTAFRNAQSKEVRLELATELSRRRAAREEDALQAELRDEQAAENMPDVPDSAFARTQEDAGPVPKNIEIQGAQQQAAPGSQAEGANVATLAQLNRKKLAEMSDDELQQLSALLPADHSRQQKIQKAIQARAAQAQPAINEGAKTDGTQTPKAQQAVAQPAKAGAAQASQSAEQGLTDGPTPAQNDGRQASAPTAPQAQAQEPSANTRAQRIADAGAQWTRMPAAERSALVGRLDGVKPVIAKNMPGAAWENLNGDIQKKLADAMGTGTVVTPAATKTEAPALMQAAKDSGKLEVVHVGGKPAKAEAKSAPEADKEGNTIVGRRKDGVMIRQDKNGVRWYAEGGVRIHETVSMRPTEEGMKVSRGELKPDFMTAEESSADVQEKAAQSQKSNTSAATETVAEKSKPAEYGASNKLVSQSRADELRAKLREKAKNHMFGGLDTEMMAWGTELAVFHLEAGVRKFSDLVAAMARDLETTPAKLKPYLRSWYNGARDMMEDHGLSIEGMDSPETVRAELAKIDAEVSPPAAEVATMEAQARTDEDKGVANGNPEQAGRAADQGRAPEVSGRGGRNNDSAAPADSGDLESRQPGDVSAPADAGGAGSDGVRVPAADVGRAGPSDKGGRAGDGRTRASGAHTPDAGTGKQPSVKAPEEVSPANPGPGNFHLDNPLEIVGGTPVARFDKNMAAIELLNQLRESERQATAEEQRTLAGYTGWGSFGQELFQGTWAKPMPKQGWEKRDQWLRDHLGQDEWESAQRSITNAHYTDPPTVMAMWDMVKRMGFGGGRVLEPSMGIGNFFGMMPADIKGRSQLAGIELDSLTGAMATRLYPDANIKVMGYQQSKTPDNFYDVVIGNWPFENTVIADRRYNTLSPFLHDYFFLKALDQVRPGGLVVGITSNGTMDKKATRIRAALARKAELVTSIRLPSGAFKEYAGTSVVTDIVILKKRDKALSLTPNEPWINSVAFKTPAGPEVFINEFYAQNPGNVIGETDFGHGTTRMQPGMIVHRPENMAERLRQAVNLVPEGVFAKEDRTQHISYVTNHTADREGSLSEQGGQLFVVRGEHLAPAQEVRKYALKSEAATAKREQELRALIDMRRKYAALIEAERDGKADDARKALREAYEAFNKEHGDLGDSFGLDYLRKIDDPFYPALAALTVNGKPSDILSKSTIRGARGIENPTAQDAYVLARNKSVEPSLSEIAALAGKPEAEVRAELVKSGAVFEAPNGDVVPSDIYLSGNVRQKLREAQAALDDGNKAMERNVAELKKVIPEDVPYFNIESQLGATWVPAKAYAEYVAHMLNRPSADGIEATFLNGRWKIRLPDGANHSTEARTGFGTEYYPFSKLVNAAFTNQTVKIRRKDSDGNEYVDTEATDEANARIGDIRTKFGEWLWSDPERRASLEAEYNESRNAYATPKYDGSFLSFDGMALSLGRGPFNLRQHQVNAIWRALVNRRSLNAHEVGTGKTFTMGGIAVESRRYGIAKKPVLLAHNANSASVAAEIQMMYPAAKVLYIDNLDKDSIAVRMRQIANDDWDTIVMPHSLIDRLSFREETLMEMAREDIRALEEEAYAAAEEDGVNLTAEMMNDEDELKKVRSITAKELVKARNRIIETVKKQAMQSSREGAIPFEDLGIDMVLVDEAHEFKKPPISTRMNMKGLNTQTSNRSIALQFITRYIRANNFGGNVHTFTGTPITNTLTEIFHQMKYVMEDEMKAAGVDSWDGWFGSFAKEVQDVELSAAGEYEAINRLAGFINVPELRRMIGQYMDVVFADDMPEMQPRKVNGKTLTSADLSEAERAELLNGRTENAADRPYKKVVNVTSDLTDEQSRIFSELQGYARRWRNMSGKERKEAMYAGAPESPIITEGLANKASFDVRLMQDEAYAGQEGNVPDSPGSKASKVVGNVLEIYNSDDRAAQVIFAEQGFSTSKDKSMGRDPGGKKITRRAKTFSTMRDIVERLVQGGIPREQIAIVDGSTSKEKRKEIADAMNALTVRVVIGSTDTLGVGVNMQRNLRAMHHMDAPYMPGELEQRNGRGLRQGNQWNTVLEYRYMTDRLDGRRWQILAIKQRFITAFMKANSDSRVIEGDAASDEESDIVQSFSEAAGDPRILIRAKLRKNVEALQRAERMHGNGVADARRNMRTAKEAIEWNRGKLREMTANKLPERLRAMMLAQSDAFTATVQGKTFDVRKDAEEAIDQFLKTEMRMEQSGVKVATYRDQTITARWPSLSSQPELVMEVDGQEFSSGGLRGLEQQIRNFPGRIERVEAVIAEREGSIERLEQVSKAPFARAADLDAAQKRLEALEKDIEVNPVPPPAWLRAGAPVDSEAFRAGQPFVVTGHRWTQDGWFVLGQDAKGEMAIPYNEVMDAQGMPLYEEREFQAPEVIEKEDKAAAPAAAPAAPAEDAANFEGNAKRRPSTAQDKAVMLALADGKGARDVLRLIANGSKDPFRRQVARLLLKAGITPNVQFGHIGKSADGFPIHGQYRGRSDTILMAGSAEYAAERIFMHEAMHAATMRALAKPGLPKLQLQKLLEHVRKQKGAAGFYGTKNVDEFVAEVFTNPDFQAALRKMSAPSGSSAIKTAWDGFVRILRSILGLKNDPNNALSQALELGVAAMREDMTLRKQGSGKVSAMANHQGVAGDNSGRPASDTQEGPADGFVRLYHGGGKDVTDIKDGGSFNRFDGLFASGSRESAASHGVGSMYYMDVPEGKILTQRMLDYEIDPDEVAAALRKSMPWLHEDDFDAAYEAVIEDRHNGMDQDEMMRIFREDDFGNASWEAQRIRGKVAKALGYLAVDMDDEHGTSQLVLPGNKVHPLNESAASDDPDADIANFGADNFAALKASALEQLHQTLSHPGKVSLWDKTVGTMRHLAERVPQFKPVFEAAQRFIDDVSMLANDAADFAPRLMPRVDSMGDIIGKNRKKPITAADNKAVAKPLFEGTLMWARDLDGTPVTTEALNAKYANTSADEKAQIMLRTGKLDALVLNMWKGMPIDSFEKAVAGKFDSTILKPGIVWKPNELKTIFKLDDKQVSLYQEARAAIDRSLDMTARTDMMRVMGEQFAGMREAVLGQQDLDGAFKLVVDTLQDEAQANPDMADRLMQMKNAVVKRYETATELMDKGYAPLSRFGKYTVDVVDASGERQYFGMFESMREANQMTMKMRDVFKGAAVTQGTMSEQAFKLFQGITPESLEQFGSMLGLGGEGNEAQDKAFQAYLQLAKNNHSALKRLIHRKGIDGYSEDVGRVLASFVYSNARLGSGGLNAGTMEKAVEGIPKEMGELRDVAMGLRSYIQDPQEEGQAVRGMLFAQYLGGSVASALVNMTQPFQITMPWLSQFGGMRKAASQMASALKDMGTKGFKYESDLAKALQDAEDDGTVSPQEIHQLMAQARGTGSLRTGDGTKLGDARAAASNNWERVKVVWVQPFALAEQFNRRSTFIAAYRIAKDQGMADPAEFARKAVLETQFLYSKANKMRFARGALGGTLMTFKTYSVSYLELMHRMWTQGGPEGKRAVGWAVAMLLLMGGAGGLPFMEDAEDLIDMIGQMMGYNLSTKQWRKEAMSDILGKEFAEFMEQGVSGLPGAPVDVSGRLGMGNLIPGTGLFLAKQNRERDLTEIAGPAGDLVTRGFSAGKSVLSGVLNADASEFSNAAMEIAPTAVRNAAKGIDMATSGIYKDTKGYKVMDVTLAEAASKFLGFQPKSVAEDGEASSFKQRTKSFYIQTSADIKAQWAAAVFNKDDAALERVRDRLAAWNRNNPDLPITVKIPDIMKKVREMGKDREQRINDTAPKALRQQFREMAQDANR